MKFIFTLAAFFLFIQTASAELQQGFVFVITEKSANLTAYNSFRVALTKLVENNEADSFVRSTPVNSEREIVCVSLTEIREERFAEIYQEFLKIAESGTLLIDIIDGRCYDNDGQPIGNRERYTNSF